MTKQISLNHGSGGKLTHKLIDDIFIKYFDNPALKNKTDSALLKIEENKNLAFTTDSYVINPIFFPGGDIGKLAVCGTVNDLAVSGAKPLYLSCGIIIEEGLPIHELDVVAKSMSETAKKCGVEIVCGDTKIVEKGACDKLFINTAGIGAVNDNFRDISLAANVEVGDKIIVNGFIADHEIAVLGIRNSFDFKTDVESDCAGLNHLIGKVLSKNYSVKFIRDATRGGLATVLCELVEMGDFGITIDESSVPVRENVNGICELLGFDPLYLANEGKAIFVVKREDAAAVLKAMQSDDLGKNSRIIGEITEEHRGIVTLDTVSGGGRIIEMLAGGQLPRIC